MSKLCLVPAAANIFGTHLADGQCDLEAPAMQLLAHADEITMAAASGTLAQIISIRVTSDGQISARWSGFDTVAELLGTLEVGAHLLKGQAYARIK